MACVSITQEAVRKANALETAISRGTAKRTTVSRAKIQTSFTCRRPVMGSIPSIIDRGQHD